MKREVAKVSKIVEVETLKLETEIERLARRKIFAESVGDKILQTVDITLPLCETPSDVRELASAFKSVYEPMFKQTPDTAIQVNNTIEQPKQMTAEEIEQEMIKRGIHPNHRL